MPALGWRSLDDIFLITIRHALAADLDLLCEIEASCFDSDQISRRSYRDWLKKTHALILLAEHHGTPAGSLLLILPHQKEWSRIYSVAVLSAFRGKGIARKLIAAAEQFAWENARKRILLEVKQHNTDAIRLYQMLGYQQFGTYPNYYCDHSTAIRMDKLLPSTQTTIPEVEC